MARKPSILITGGTGFLGGHLCQKLLSAKKRPSLRLLCSGLPPQWVNEQEIEVQRGSITDPDVVARAVEGVEQIYHLAGKVSRSASDAHVMYAIHVDGTRHLIEVARRAGVKKMVLVSTSGTIAVATSEDRNIDETHATPVEIIGKWPYYASKLYQEQVALDLCTDDAMTLCIANPSLLLGPGDDRLSSTNDVLRFLRREIPTIPNGGINFVDVRDIAEVLVTMMARGRHRERYLLGGPNWTLAEFFARLERMTKVSGPKITLPKPLTLWGAKAMETFYRTVDRVAPIDYASVEMATHYWWFDDHKARSELGFTSREPAETLLDTVKYLETHVL